VWRGNVSAAPPFVFFHAHPRSTEEFRLFMEAVPESQPFVAVDYFGAGFSDECQCDDSTDEFVSYPTFAAMTLEICDKLGVKKMLPFGSLNGANGAIELAWLAAKQGRVDHLLNFESFYLSPKAKAYIDQVYIPSVRHLPIFQNGSHMTFWWFKPDAGPIGPTSTTPAPSDLWANEQKSVDALLALRTGWQIKMACPTAHRTRDVHPPAAPCRVD
jgi:pimeloyl-ACP methyl ester carboxylesterase